MDLKGKRIAGVAQIIFFAAMLALYTRIGGAGMIYAAGSMELFFVITCLFLGKIPETMDYMIRLRRKKEQFHDAANVWKAGALYGVLGTLFTELGILLIKELLLAGTGLLYVEKLLELFMIAVPFIACMQVIRGVMQAEFDRVLVEISGLLFVVCTVLGTVVAAGMLGDYGRKAAKLMQSVPLEHFYTLLGLIPGVVTGAIAASLFLVVIGFLHRTELTVFDSYTEPARAGIPELCMELMKNRLPEVIVPCVKRLPILLLLWLSIGEISVENYLFGNFYGAVLPIFGIAWTISDLGLADYKKRLFTAYRKKAHELYYRDLKTMLCYVILHSAFLCACTLALHKSYLAIWNLQTFTSFMELAAWSSIIGLLGLPCMVLEEALKYRSMQGQSVFAVLAGVCIAFIAGICCAGQIGAGTVLYVVCIGVQMLVTMLLMGFSLSASVGIHYLSVILRTIGCVAVTFADALLMYGLQRMLFTALGGLATLIICVMVGMAVQLVAVLALHVFDRDEYSNLPFAFLTRNLSRFFG